MFERKERQLLSNQERFARLTYDACSRMEKILERLERIQENAPSTLEPAQPIPQSESKVTEKGIRHARSAQSSPVTVSDTGSPESVFPINGEVLQFFSGSPQGPKAIRTWNSQDDPMGSFGFGSPTKPVAAHAADHFNAIVTPG